MEGDLITRFCKALPDAMQLASLPVDFGSLEVLSPGEGVADATAKILVRDPVGDKIAFVLSSSPTSPDLAARGMRRAAKIKQALGAELGSAILQPIHEGMWEGLSYVVLPYAEPLRGRWQRRRVRSEVFAWLRGATEESLSLSSADDVGGGFRRPLLHLHDLEGVPANIRSSAENALKRLDAGQWEPRFSLMHGDFHFGNLLRATKTADPSVGWGTQRILIIDWPGSCLRGQGVYDLIRAAASLKLTGRALVRELTAHARILCCAHEDLRSYLLAALGALGMQLEHFPKDAYLRLLNNCHSALPD